MAANPHARAAELYTGVAGLTGPQASVAEISSVLYNVDRIKAELQHMKENSVGEFADDLVKFQNEHPGFVLHSQIEDIAVVIMQTRYMAAPLIKDYRDQEVVNEIVSDAAHGYWMDHKKLLIFSSIF